MNVVTLASLEAAFNAALEYRAAQLNEKTAATLRAKTLEDHAGEQFSTAQNGYAEAANAVRFHARRLIAALATRDGEVR